MSLPAHYDDIEMDWVGDWIGRRARLTPEREAVFEPDRGRWSYAQLEQRAQRTGAYLLGVLSLQKGDVVALLSRNRVEALDLYFAAGKTGLVLAPLSHRLTAPELAALVGIIRPRALFYEECFSHLVEDLTTPGSIAHCIAIDDSGLEFERRITAGQGKDVNRALAMRDPFLYVHTGGSSGRPKVCVVSHRQMLWNSFNLLATGSGGLGAETRELVTFPLYHIGGWNTVTPLVHIGGFLVLPRRFDAGQTLELIEREGITHFGAVEAMLHLLVQSPRFEEACFQSIRSITSAGAPCAPALINMFLEKRIPLTQSYGLTEAGPSNCILLPEGRTLAELSRLSQSIGHPMFHCQAQVRSLERDQEVGPGEVGELCIRGPHSFEGYLTEDGIEAPNVDAQGWVRTGDLVRLSAEGLLHVVGRCDNIYLSGGENVSPEEVEQVLREYPDVEEVCVVDIPDAQWGRVGAAVVRMRRGADLEPEEVRSFCRSSLAPFKIPKLVVATEAFPLTGAGKVDRPALKRWVMDEIRRREK